MNLSRQVVFCTLRRPTNVLDWRTPKWILYYRVLIYMFNLLKTSFNGCFSKDWPCELRHCNQSQKAPAQIPLGGCPGLRTQLRYEDRSSKHSDNLFSKILIDASGGMKKDNRVIVKWYWYQMIEHNICIAHKCFIFFKWFCKRKIKCCSVDADADM